MYYTYVLQSARDDGFYVGFTKDLKLRFEQHAKGGVDSTKNRRPIELIYKEIFEEKSEALKREKIFKSGKGREYLNEILK